MTQTFVAISQGGELEWQDRERLRQFLLFNPGELFINIGRRNRRRSLKQNAYAYGVVYGLFASHTGYSVREVKDLLKEEFGLYRWVEFNGRQRKVYRSTADLTAHEHEDFMAKVRMLGDTMGIFIPEPNSPGLIDRNWV